ncbi:HAMP domain-containing histidine kinase [Salinimonas marina]|uniref:histidine kinase n=1 Tax=Salinimonas marina TaxID=2785918 RepID=A0A7S9HDS7_9ALTE|nr:HAMP domain-containing sensor histidine kinase [Salinimonas marina]QPG06247.1 HAMP domain-containing histidine kinase [Salinimonas marina]
MIAIRTFTRSSSFRLGALLTLLSSAAMTFVFYVWSLSNEETLLREARAAVDAQVWGYQAWYQAEGREGLISAINNNPFSSTSTLVSLQSADGEFLAGNLTSLDSLSVPEGTDFFQFVFSADMLSGARLDKAQRAVLFKDIILPDGSRLFLARDVEDLYTAQWIGQSFSWVFVAVLGCISGLSFGVAMYVVNRINRMSQTADTIMQTGNLTERLDIDSNWDDLSKLAVVLNRMLDKIEASVENIKSVTDNIAHDLRTPLSRLRSRLDKLPEGEIKAQAQAEADNLLGMFNGLLRIADIESQRQRQGFTTISLAEVLRDVVDLYEPYFEEHQMQLTTNINSVTMYGDPNQLFQMMANLMDNTVKYAGTGNRVDVSLTTVGQRIVLSVSDTGAGLDEKHFAQLDRRFYRAQASRTTAGNGLGLSMVKAVAELHNGTVYYVPDPLLSGSGLGVTITFAAGEKLSQI